MLVARMRKRFYDFFHGGHDKFRLVELDPVRAPGSDYMRAWRNAIASSRCSAIWSGG
jgi:hypothetical protein